MSAVQTSFATADQEEALEYLRGAYATTFSVARTGAPFRLRHRRTDHGPWTSDRTYLDAGRFDVEPYGVVSVTRCTAGRGHLTSGRDHLDLARGDLFLSSDGTRPYTAGCTASEATDLRLPLATLERVARESVAVPAGTRLRFLARRPVSARAGRRLVDVVGFAEHRLGDDGTPSVGVLRAAVGDLLAATVLATFPNTLVPESSVLRPRDDVPLTVALALDFVTRNADLPITVADVAAHASVSRRALEMAFRDHLGTTPATHLRRRRLARVHEELTAAEPGDGTTVTAVAARWGFTPSSRFTAHYRELYGELPEPHAAARAVTVPGSVPPSCSPTWSAGGTSGRCPGATEPTRSCPASASNDH